MTFKGYRISSNFGNRTHPITNKPDFHGGVDLVKEHRSPIKPFKNGKVIYAGMNKQGFGNLVIVESKDNYKQYYAHMDSTSVSSGEYVSTSNIIGRQGATGNVTGSHLHFEVRDPNNKQIDPIKYIEKGGNDRMVEILEVDGYRGEKTISRWQQFLGSVVDGKISKPSLVIEKWQEFLNKYGGADLKIDGYEGTETIKETQRFFNSTVDGKISKPSLVIKELQKFLNNYGR